MFRLFQLFARRLDPATGTVSSKLERLTVEPVSLLYDSEIVVVLLVKRKSPSNKPKPFPHHLILSCVLKPLR